MQKTSMRLFLCLALWDLCDKVNLNKYFCSLGYLIGFHFNSWVYRSINLFILGNVKLPIYIMHFNDESSI